MLSTRSTDERGQGRRSAPPRCLFALMALLVGGCAGAPVGDIERAPPSTAARQDDPAQSVRPAFEHALRLMEKGRYSEAERLLSMLARAHPMLAGPVANLGIIYSETGRIEEAEKSFRAALELNRENAAVYNHLGILYRKAGKFEAARRAYEQAIDIDPGYARAHLNLGILLDLYLQRPANALTHYRSYQRLAGKDREVAMWIVDLERRLEEAGEDRKGEES